jgi:branched-subunit amino acid ABC-type transport system permease component
MIDPVALALVDTLGALLRAHNLMEVFLEGLTRSGVYVSIAAGLTLIFGLMGVLNFAHGSFTMLGTYFGGFVLLVVTKSVLGTGASWGVLLVALLVVLGLVLVLFSVGGAALEMAVIRPLYDRPPIYQILLTFGLTLIFDEFLVMLLSFYDIPELSNWTDAVSTSPAIVDNRHVIGEVLFQSHDVGLLELPGIVLLDVVLVGLGILGGWYYVTSVQSGAELVASLDGVPESYGGHVGAAVGAVGLVGVSNLGFWLTDMSQVQLRGIEVLELAFGLVTVIGVWAFLTQTRYGLYIRAGSEDDEMAQALGINVNRVFTFVFALGTGITGAAGVILLWDAVLFSIIPELGANVLLPAFIVVIIGGLGTFRGTVVASVIVGMTDALMDWLLVNGDLGFSQLGELAIFGLLVVMLIVRPQGLYGLEEVGGH